MIAQAACVANLTIAATSSGWTALDFPGAEPMPVQRQFRRIVKIQNWVVESMAQDLALGDLSPDWFEDGALDAVELGEDQHHSDNLPIAIALYAHLSRLFQAWEDLKNTVEFAAQYDRRDRMVENDELDRLGLDLEAFQDVDGDVSEAWEAAQGYFAEVWGI